MNTLGLVLEWIGVVVFLLWAWHVDMGNGPFSVELGVAGVMLALGGHSTRELGPGAHK